MWPVVFGLYLRDFSKHRFIGKFIQVPNLTLYFWGFFIAEGRKHDSGLQRGESMIHAR